MKFLLYNPVDNISSIFLGDSGKKLPVDAFYKELNLVIEYGERQHIEELASFDKPTKPTIGGVNRGQQRKIYDHRRREVLPRFGIELLEISYLDFKYDKQKRIKRDRATDVEIL
jgi:hypothetical protein